jgi:hypothetical protein
MLAWIVYCMGTLTAGLILAFLVSLFFGGPSQRAEKPFRMVLFCIALTMAGPFLFSEVLTATYGDEMRHAVKLAYNDSPISGPFQYFKVTSYTGSHATAIAIGEEQAAWGGTDRPILSVSLSKEGANWKADSYTVVYSNRLNKDGIDFPPYQ